MSPSSTRPTSWSWSRPPTWTETSGSTSSLWTLAMCFPCWATTAAAGSPAWGPTPPGRGPSSAGARPCALAAAVLDRDGALAVAAGNQSSGNVSGFPNAGAGALGPKSSYGSAAGQTSLAVGALDGDGDLDLATSDNQ